MIQSKVKTIEGDEDITAFLWNEGDLPIIKFSKMQRNKKIYLYADDFMTLDTETSHSDEFTGWIYQWALKCKDIYFYGRTPEELIHLLERMRDHYNLHKMKRIILYIHNQSYDIQYLKRYLQEYDPSLKILATDNHSFLITDVFGFRILCSYRISNMNLDLFSNTYAEKYRKAVGEIDYNIVRYQDTPLTSEDWYYQFSDVASQMDAIIGYLKVNGYDKAYKAPFTSTGFVRAVCRHRSEKEKGWRKKFEKSKLSLDQYMQLRQTFMGGITIASYRYAGTTIKDKPLGHKDFTSSYPARQMMDYFPEGAPSWYGDIDDIEELHWLCDEYCCCFILNLKGVEIKEGVTAPYIPSSKCIWLKGDLRLNGKVIVAYELTIAVTEIDYKWIERQYTYEEIRVSNMLTFKRGEAPKWLKESVMDFYDKKCNLKKSDPRLYMASKAHLNAIYGMSATSIIRDKYDMDEECIISSHSVRFDEEDKLKQINKYYSSFNSFMPYQLGVWTTAHARDALMQMIECVGYDNFLYCDTDSVFYIKTDENEKRLSDMNDRIKERAIRAGAYIGDNILGLATDEDPISEFRALHAKCYAMIENGTLKVTIAGIPKKSIKWRDGAPITMTNAEELGSIDNLKSGVVFRHCGGTRTIYNEDPIRHITVNGHNISLASSAIIENISKEINETMYDVDEDGDLIRIIQHQKIE